MISYTIFQALKIRLSDDDKNLCLVLGKLLVITGFLLLSPFAYFLKTI